MSELSSSDLELCLLQLLAPDTNQIKQAERVLKEQVLSKPSVIEALFNQIQCSTRVEVRQMAAVLLRKKINRFWSKNPQENQIQMKAFLLQQIIAEPERLVRKSLCSLIATIAKHQLPGGNWPELLGFISQCSQSDNEIHRELGMQLFNSLTESVGTFLQPHFPEIKGLFLTALQDPCLKVRMMAMRATCSMLDYLGEGKEIMEFQELVPHMIEVVRVCLANNFEEEATEFLNIFAEVTETPLPIFTQHLPVLVRFLLETFVHQPSVFEPSTLSSVGNVISALLEHKPKTVAKMNLINDIVSAMMHRIALDNSSAGGTLSCIINMDEDDVNNDDDDDDTPTQIAQRVLDILALNMPPKYFEDNILKMCAESLNSADAATRKAGIITLGVIAEGCRDSLANRLNDLLPCLYQAARDPSSLLRESSCFALGQFSEYLQPEILDHYNTLLPVVFDLLDDATPTVKGTSCYVLECFTENMDPEAVRPFLNSLMTKLVDLVQNSKPHVKVMAISAIGSTAVGAEQAFLPFLPAVSEMLLPYLTISEPKYFGLRGRALECMGYIAVAVGKEHFQQCLNLCMECAISGCELNAVELGDFSFAFFCNVSKTFGQDFAPFLERVVPLMINSLKPEDGIEIQGRKGADAGLGDFCDDEEDDEDISGATTTVSVRTALMDLKSGAIGAIEALAEETGGLFQPYVAICMHALAELTDYIHPDVRGDVASALGQLILVIYEAHPSTPWVKGEPNASPLHEKVKIMLDAVMKTYIVILVGDNETVADAEVRVVEKALHSITLLCEKIGPAAITDFIHDIMKAVLSILNNDHPCQLTAEDDDDDEDNEVGSMLEAACDLISQLSKCYGSSFNHFFQNLFPSLIKFTNGVRPATDRGVAIGCLAECCSEMAPVSAQYIDQIFPVILRGLTHESPSIKQNGVYCMGVLAEIGLDEQHFLSVLQAIRPLFDHETNSVVDNSCAAVARMIMAKPHAVPMNQVLPVFLSALPLKDDLIENETVYKCFLGLLNQAHPDMINLLPQVLLVLSNSLKEDSELTDEVKHEVALSWKNLYASKSAEINQILPSISEEARNILSLHAN